MAVPCHFGIEEFLYLVKVTPNLYRAQDMRGLIRFAGQYPDCSAWILLRPLSEEPKFYDATGAQSVDALSAGQIGELPHPGNGISCGHQASPWLKKMTSLLSYQFPAVGRTSATMLTWEKSELVSVIGVCAPGQKVEEARTLAHDLAYALHRMHEGDALRSELRACRYVINHWRHPVLIARHDMAIVAMTEPGSQALHGYLRRRQSQKSPVTHLPPALRAAVRAPGSAINGGYTVTVSQLPCEEETVAPLLAITLSIVLKQASDVTLEEKVRTLTRSQKAVYDLVLAGKRNKEIATELGISLNTVWHHVTATFQKIGVMDRLQLFAMAGIRKVTPEILVAPPLSAAPVASDLVIPTSVSPRRQHV